MTRGAAWQGWEGMSNRVTIEIECTLSVSDDVGREMLRAREEMRAELERLSALPRDACGCEHLQFDETEQRWVCTGMCTDYGVRAGERVAVAVPAIPWTDRGDQVAAPWPGEAAIGVTQTNGRPGELVDVVTDEREHDVVREMFRVAHRSRVPQ